MTIKSWALLKTVLSKTHTRAKQPISNTDLFRNIYWKNALMLATNPFAYYGWIQGEDFIKHLYLPTSEGTEVSSDSVTQDIHNYFRHLS